MAVAASYDEFLETVLVHDRAQCGMDWSFDLPQRSLPHLWPCKYT
jgi:hypothetical protein